MVKWLKERSLPTMALGLFIYGSYADIAQHQVTNCFVVACLLYLVQIEENTRK